MGLKLRRATVSEIERGWGVVVDCAAHGYIGEVDGEAIGCGGLAWGAGRCWIWFVTNKPGSFPIAILKGARKLQALAVSLGEKAVYATRDAEYETSSRLLRLAGFEPTDETMDGREVWMRRLQPGADA